jgi:hypothetical protein
MRHRARRVALSERAAARPAATPVVGLLAAVMLRQPNSVAPDTTSADQPERELVTA